MHKQTRGLDYVHHITQPHWFEEGGDDSPEAFGIRAARALEQKIDELGEENVAAFIAEPIQGAGGVIVPPDSYWPEVQRICDERDILLIMDEVICGFGRTGNWFGSQTLNIRPHIMTVAKGLSSGYQPIGGSIVCDEVAEVIGATEFNHGYTYSGHPAGAAAVIANLELIEAEARLDVLVRREHLARHGLDLLVIAGRWNDHAACTHDRLGPEAGNRVRDFLDDQLFQFLAGHRMKHSFASGAGVGFKYPGLFLYQ